MDDITNTLIFLLKLVILGITISGIVAELNQRLEKIEQQKISVSNK